ncbi:hypothetical protein GGS23DRAFT_607393 [Durotheca rogersii]|uniref:uncharacterized protein n=1 Tax=Durotheca rogersii TaxID=419775 RepID=UPI00221F4193|nr:uncharacterized protein GGS23DRAFT_607393 [Durotheca rogersii]KAI5859690.1 hypothetical protein GGS23DRAFT_607393 [Durotheca rogersii]
MKASSAIAIRAYGTNLPKSSLGATLSLDHFILRSSVLSLYRRVLRGTRRISDRATRVEARNYARSELERHRGVSDAAHIRFLLSTGRTEWENMERYIGGI